MPILVGVEIAVHPFQDEKKQHAAQSQREQEDKDRPGSQVFALKLHFPCMPADVAVFNHAPAPGLLLQRRHRQEQVASNLNCGKSMPATSRPWRSGRPRPAKSHSTSWKSWVR